MARQNEGKATADRKITIRNFLGRGFWLPGGTPAVPFEKGQRVPAAVDGKPGTLEVPASYVEHLRKTEKGWARRMGPDGEIGRAPLAERREAEVRAQIEEAELRALEAEATAETQAKRIAELEKALADRAKDEKKN